MLLQDSRQLLHSILLPDLEVEALVSRRGHVLIPASLDDLRHAVDDPVLLGVPAGPRSSQQASVVARDDMHRGDLRLLFSRSLERRQLAESLQVANIWLLELHQDVVHH